MFDVWLRLIIVLFLNTTLVNTMKSAHIRTYSTEYGSTFDYSTRPYYQSTLALLSSLCGCAERAA